MGAVRVLDTVFECEYGTFESQEAFDQFGAVVGPIATEAGIEEPPKSFPLHTYISV